MTNKTVKPTHVYQPQLCITPMCKTFALICGACNMVFVKFSFTGKPRCPFCKTINTPEWEPRP